MRESSQYFHAVRRPPVNPRLPGPRRPLKSGSCGESGWPCCTFLKGQGTSAQLLRPSLCPPLRRRSWLWSPYGSPGSPCNGDWERPLTTRPKQILAGIIQPKKTDVTSWYFHRFPFPLPFSLWIKKINQVSLTKQWELPWLWFPESGFLAWR